MFPQQVRQGVTEIHWSVFEAWGGRGIVEGKAAHGEN